MCSADWYGRRGCSAASFLTIPGASCIDHRSEVRNRRDASMVEQSNIIYCEVCRLPHQRGATVCEECDHRLGTKPDWNALKAELPELRQKIAGGVAAIVGMIVLNGLLFGGAGYIVTLAPVVWTVVQ